MTEVVKDLTVKIIFMAFFSYSVRTRSVPSISPNYQLRHYTTNKSIIKLYRTQLQHSKILSASTFQRLVILGLDCVIEELNMLNTLLYRGNIS